MDKSVKVLDLDRDYFLKCVPANISNSSGHRLSEDFCDVWCKDRVIDFLKYHLGLLTDHKIPGRIVKDHDESLYFWEELQRAGKLSDPFEVIHVDSHADLGLGDPAWCVFQSDYLSLPKEQRRIICHDYVGSLEGKIEISNYLLWVVFYQMVSRITYCANPNRAKDDYLVDTLRDFHEKQVQRKPFSQYI